MFQEDPRYDPERCTAFQCDLTKDALVQTVPIATVDLVTMIFVLSAIHPDKMVDALKNILQVNIYVKSQESHPFTFVSCHW